jgi:hypothetical protein
MIDARKMDLLLIEAKEFAEHLLESYIEKFMGGRTGYKVEVEDGDLYDQERGQLAEYSQ